MSAVRALLYCEALSLVIRLPETYLAAFLEFIAEGVPDLDGERDRIDELIRQAERIAPEELEKARRDLRKDRE